MSDEYTNKHGYLLRYFVRWVTELGDHGYLRQIAWEVCDRRKFDKIGIGVFKNKDEAEGMCKLMNSIEEEGT